MYDKRRELTAVQREFQRKYANAITPPSAPAAVCWCGCVYEDWAGGRMAHQVVFGHYPAEQLDTRGVA